MNNDNINNYNNLEANPSQHGYSRLKTSIR